MVEIFAMEKYRENDISDNTNMLKNYNISKIGIIGAGNLVQILIKGFLSTGNATKY